MENLNYLYDWLDKEGVYVFDQNLPFSNKETKAATIQFHNDKITGIFLDKERMDSTSEEYSALLHESGHYATGALHKVSSPLD